MNVTHDFYIKCFGKLQYGIKIGFYQSILVLNLSRGDLPADDFCKTDVTIGVAACRFALHEIYKQL